MTVTLTWQMILTAFLAICSGITVVCVAAGHLIKIVQALRKPSKNTKARLDRHDQLFENDHKRIQALEEKFAFVLKAIPILLQDDLVIIKHLRTSNNTGKMEEQEEKLNEFLLNRE
jgi:hypothetical protein